MNRILSIFFVGIFAATGTVYAEGGIGADVSNIVKANQAEQKKRDAAAEEYRTDTAIELTGMLQAAGYSDVTVSIHDDTGRFCDQACTEFMNEAIEADNGLIDTIARALKEAEETLQGGSNIKELKEIVIMTDGDGTFFGLGKSDRASLRVVPGKSGLRLTIRVYYEGGFGSPGLFTEEGMDEFLDDVFLHVEEVMSTADPYYRPTMVGLEKPMP